MKKYIALILAALLIPSVAFSAGITDSLRAVVAAKNTGGVCTSYYSKTTDADANETIGRYVNQAYKGTKWLDSTTSGEICTVKIKILSCAGTPSANDYYVELWDLSGTSLNSVIGRSDKVDGAAWSNELVTFNFSTAAPYNQNTEYRLTVKSIDSDDPANTAAEIDDVNYCLWRFDNENNGGGLASGVYNYPAAKTQFSVDAQDDFLIEVWTNQ